MARGCHGRDHKILNRSDSAFAFAVTSITPLADSPAINTAEFYQAKILALSFTVSADVEGRQVIYEQGGDGFAFLGTGLKLAQYNAALTGAHLQ